MDHINEVELSIRALSNLLFFFLLLLRSFKNKFVICIFHLVMKSDLFCHLKTKRIINWLCQEFFSWTKEDEY